MINNSSAPAARAFVIVPSNTVPFTEDVRAIYVGGGGDISVLPAGGGAAVILKNVPQGTVIPIQAAQVNVTGTTATDLVALV